MAEKKTGKKQVRVRVPKNAFLVRFFLHPIGKFLALTCAIIFLAVCGAGIHYWTKYSRLIDAKLSAGPFANTAKIFAAPRLVAVGDAVTADDIIAELRRSGYSEARGNPMGWYHMRPDGGVEIFPGPMSYFDQEAGVIKFANGRISQIVSLSDNTARSEYQLEPQLITNLSDRNRPARD